MNEVKKDLEAASQAMHYWTYHVKGVILRLKRSKDLKGEFKLCLEVLKDKITFESKGRNYLFRAKQISLIAAALVCRRHEATDDLKFVRSALLMVRIAGVAEIQSIDNNHNDFTFKNVIETIQYLSLALEKIPEDFECMGRFEIGVNLDIKPYKVFDIIESYKSLETSHSTKFQLIEPKSGKPICTKAFLTEYQLKAYDKGRLSGLPLKDRMRLELIFTKNTRLKSKLNKKRVSLADLTEAKNIIILCEELIKQYDGIRKMPLLNDVEVEREDMLELLAYSDPTMMKYDKKYFSTHHLLKRRRKYKRLLRRLMFDEKGVHEIVRNRLLKKLDNLLDLPLYNIRDKFNRESKQNDLFEKLKV